MTAITTSFDARSTAADVVAGVDLTGKRAIVTGASSGIGIETARALAGAGANVTLAVRDLDAGARAAKDIAATAGRADLDVAALDLSSPASVTAFAAAWRGPLDILVNNAGVMMSPEERTAQGWELQLATNHLGHFAGPWPPRRARRHRRRAHRRRELIRAPLLPRRLRRPALPLPPVRPAARLRPVQDRGHPLRGRRDRALGG
jgi:short chain dehydrogenase